MNMPRFALPAMIAAALASATAAAPYRQVLTSVERNFCTDAWQATHRDLDLKTAAKWSVSKFTLHGGKQEGVDLIVLDNGRMTITIVPTRGMGILKAECGDVRLGWDSPLKEVVHPQFVNLERRGGLGWLDGFNEWICRCGLEFAGHPGRDKFITNTGAEAEMDLTLHGKIANIPASEVEVVIDREPPHRIRVRGVVREFMMFGPHLELTTEISTEPGSSALRVADTVKNHAGLEQEFQLMYHANFGAPLMGKGAKFLAPIRRLTPFNANAAKGVRNYGDYDGPTKGYIEQVFCTQLFAGQDHRSTVMLRNAAADRAVTLTLSTDQLPYFTLWKNCTLVEEGYVTGLEPGTGFPNNRRIERKAGRVPKLAPGQSRQFVTEYEVLAGKADVERVARQIQDIQAGRKTQVDAEPLRVE
jgi:galactose mutarotase-like enzyme